MFLVLLKRTKRVIAEICYFASDTSIFPVLISQRKNMQQEFQLIWHLVCGLKFMGREGLPRFYSVSGSKSSQNFQEVGMIHQRFLCWIGTGLKQKLIAYRLTTLQEKGRNFKFSIPWIIIQLLNFCQEMHNTYLSCNNITKSYRLLHVPGRIGSSSGSTRIV